MKYVIRVDEERYAQTKNKLKEYGKITYETTFIPIIFLETEYQIADIEKIDGVENVEMEGKFGVNI